MQKLHTLETDVLVDMLAAQTEDYTRMRKEGISEKDFAKCCLSIRAIQSEIDSRKQTEANTSTDSHVILSE